MVNVMPLDCCWEAHIINSRTDQSQHCSQRTVSYDEGGVETASWGWLKAGCGGVICLNLPVVHPSLSLQVLIQPTDEVYVIKQLASWLVHIRGWTPFFAWQMKNYLLKVMLGKDQTFFPSYNRVLFLLTLIMLPNWAIGVKMTNIFTKLFFCCCINM